MGCLGMSGFASARLIPGWWVCTDCTLLFALLQAGLCGRGSECSFAHSRDELFRYVRCLPILFCRYYCKISIMHARRLTDLQGAYLFRSIPSARQGGGPIVQQH